MSLFEINGHSGEMVVGGNISVAVFNEEAAEQGAPQEYLRPLDDQPVIEITMPDLAVAASGLAVSSAKRLN